MIAEFTLTSAKGFMNQRSIKTRTVGEALNKVLPWLDKLPDHIEDVPVTDWTEITITIRRSK